MKTKNVVYLITLVTFLFIAVSGSFAQEEKNVEKPMMQMNKMMSDSTMMKNCMEKISSDEGMRTMMMDKMMQKCSGDDEAMMEMCKNMMNNPEMHKMMKKMMDGEMMHDGMMKDKNKSNDEEGNNPEHKSHHDNDVNKNG